MKRTSIAIAAALCYLPLAAFAADPPPPPPLGWSGSGEAGLSVASGNTKSQNLNAKLDFKFNDDTWKDDFYLLAQRNKSNVKTVSIDTSTNPPTLLSTSSYDLTANRYEGGASFGYKLDERSYIVGAGRYEHDEFSAYDYQYIVSIGYGYQVLKSASDELAVEIGPGYKVVQPAAYYVLPVDPNAPAVKVEPDSDGNPVARGKIEYKHAFNATVAFVNTFVVEAGSGNKFFQNDAGLAVKMSDAFALKAGLQTRHNSEVPVGFKKTDNLFTTNLVYSF